MSDRPLILVDPLPRTLDLICEPEVHRRPEALFRIGRMMVADAELILRGMPPVMCRRADPAIARRLRSVPVSIT